ncbi:MAG: molybdopterin-dependent oxidoreductase [Terracidiphilus sp.]
MRLKHVCWMLSVAVVVSTLVCGQTPGENQGKPINGSPAPDTSRAQQEMAEAKAPAAGPLKITYGDNSAEWTATTLAPLPHTTLTLYNEHAKANETYSGVQLIDLLARLGVPAKPRGKEFRIYLVAEGSDGYQVVYSIGEVTPDVHDGTVIVADSLDGKPIGNDGPLKLVATGEKRPARWVRNLVAIKVMTAQ